MSDESDAPKDCTKLARRDLLKLGGLAGLAAGVGVAPAAAQSPLPGPTAAKAAAPQPSGAPQYPVVDVAPLAGLDVGAEIAFEYPDKDSPAVLVRLSGSAEGGIGPDSSIVAFSQLCTHQGCPLSFKKTHGMLLCGCHWSSFDPAKGGRVIIGQASERLPQIALRVSNDTIQAIGMSGLIYGRHTNIR